MADRNDDKFPGPAGPAGDDVPGSARGACRECGTKLALEQRYCVSCGTRRGLLPGAVAGTVAAMSSKTGTAVPGAGGKGGGGRKGADAGGSNDDGGGWSWMPSPPAIAIAVIGMLALGVGLGSAMSEIASSAPLSTILLEYPRHATEAPPVEEPEEEAGEEEAVVAEAPAEEAPEEVLEEPPPLPEEAVEEPLVLPPEAATEEETPLQKAIREAEEEQQEREAEEAPGGGEESLPEVKHAFLIVLGEGGYEETFGAAASAPYLSRVLPKQGELLPNYYGVTSGVLANEIALLSGQGPTTETAADCPDYTAIAPGTVAAVAEQVEGAGCVYGEAVKSLPTQLSEAQVSWRAYVQDMENGGAIGQPWRCRKPTLGGPDTSAPGPGDQYATWRNPVVYFSAIAAGAECEKHDVGFELLTKDLAAKKKTPALSLIFPNLCHSGGEYECEPGAPKGVQGVAQELKALVPAIMASPAYAEGGGLIMITSAQAPQAGERADPSGCCLAPEFPNLPAPEGTPPRGGGKVGLLMISPFVEPGKVDETEEANHFTLLKTLATMLGVEPTGYAAEAEVPTLSPDLFVEAPDAVTPAGRPDLMPRPLFPRNGVAKGAWTGIRRLSSGSN